jgi:peptidoglycan/LPS O-acetylase OafA/YrhL
MAFYHPGMHWLKGMLLTYLIILGVAFLSWHFVEKPALSLKKYFRSKPPAEREPSPDLAPVSAHA